ncbi:MAG: transporter substrate-binding domain-containing protein [Alphaproteobacteria bacterium]|nr:transporter substrate-binding domain-containing protein [Alphaproteobacteria bacterium]
MKIFKRKMRLQTKDARTRHACRCGEPRNRIVKSSCPIPAFAAAMAFLLLTAALPTPAFAADKETAWERVMRTDTIRCAYAPYDPYFTIDPVNSVVGGPFAEFAEKLASYLNLKIEWAEDVSYATYAEGFETGRYDMFCGIISVSPARARVSAYTSPLAFSPLHVYVRETDDRFDKYAQLNDSALKVGTIDGENFQLMARKLFPKAQDVSLPDISPPNQLMMDLAYGKVDFILQVPHVIKKFNENNPDLTLKKVAEEPFEVAAYAFALPLGEPDLLNLINTAILQLNLLGETDRILNSYGMDETVLFRPAHSFNAPERTVEQTP